MTPEQKLSTLNERKESLRREIADLGAAKPSSENAALADLESALLTELRSIEKQIDTIKSYIDHVQSKPTGDD